MAPSGAVLFFDGKECPTGWSPYNKLAGRVALGRPETGVSGDVYAGADPLAVKGSRTITEVPAHVHSVNPPQTPTTSVGHTHNVPAQTVSVTNTSHTHPVEPKSQTFSTGNQDNNHDHKLKICPASSTFAFSYSALAGTTTCGTELNNSPVGYNGVGHKHTVAVKIDPFTSGPAESAGTVNIPLTPTSSNAHAHNVDILPFDSVSKGSASVDVTMPYVQLLACKKD